MMKVVFAATVVILLLATESTAFSVHHRRLQASTCCRSQQATTVLYNKPSKRAVPEYFVADEEEEVALEHVQEQEQQLTLSDDHDSVHADSLESAPFMESTESLQSSQSSSSPYFYSALSTGSVIDIQVGDVSRARKAWKKRRRSGSPLLVPCSVLSVDRHASVARNIAYLVEKFGTTSSSSGGIALNMVDLASRYRSHLKTGLRQQATSLGFEDVSDLVKALFSNKQQAQDIYGIKLVEHQDGSLILQAATSRMRAQRRAQAAAMLQFQDSDDAADNDISKATQLRHTGMVRIRNLKQNSASSNKYYSMRPLSAALRINPSRSTEFSLEAAIDNGSLHQAVVFDYDPVGDAGSPLLVVALNPGRLPRDRSKSSSTSVTGDGCDGESNDSAIASSSTNPSGHRLDELSVGVELQGTVVRLAKGGAFVDCGVRRLRKDKSWAKCWGRLNFRDAVSAADGDNDHSDCCSHPNSRGTVDEDSLVEEDDEDKWSDEDDDDDDESVDVLGELDLDGADLGEDDEESEDITHLFQENADGSLSFDNPETGETEMLMVEDEEEEEDDFEDLTHLFEHGEDGSLTFTDPATGETHVVYAEGEDADLTHMFVQNDDGTLSYKGSEKREARTDDVDEDTIVRNTRSRILTTTQPLRRPQFLKVGDEMTVFVKSVSMNSGQFSLTMDASTQEKSAQDLKRESEVTKRLSRLSKQLGGLDRIQDLIGKECDGLIKATSNTGDWLYVEPGLEHVPVGVASVSDTISEPLSRGDGVRIRIEGLDEERGQLAMRILQRL